jgi:hypothetical protein
VQAHGWSRADDKAGARGGAPGLGKIGEDPGFGEDLVYSRATCQL